MPHPSDRRARITGWRLAGFWLGALGTGFALMTALASGVGALLASFLS